MEHQSTSCILFRIYSTSSVTNSRLGHLKSYRL